MLSFLEGGIARVIGLALSAAVAYAGDGSSDGFNHPRTEFTPTGLHLGNDFSPSTTDFTPFHLNEKHTVATVDFGTERAGFPFFTVSKVEEPVQVEVRYSEQFRALEQPMSDGPYPFSLGLSNCFRIETFNVTKAGRIVSPLIQGGQRWHSLRLIKGGNVAISEVGLLRSMDTRELADRPGQFHSDDDFLNGIWDLGVRATLASCLERGSQAPIWQIDPEKGALVQSLRPSQSLSASMHDTYTLEFDALIKRGGIWWNVAFPLNANSGIQLMLTGELPEGSTFANTDRNNTPANTIRMASGFAFVEQTTLPSTDLGTFSVPFDVKEGQWYRVKTVLSPNHHISVSVDDKEIFNIAVTNGLSGSFGFGAWQDQAAYVRNVTLTDTVNGTVLLQNDMAEEDVLAEFGAQANLESVCLDGPKRDRLVWLGDFYVTARIIGVSTSQFDIFRGTLDFILQTQIEDGNFNTAPVMSYDPTAQVPFLSADGSLGQQDYEVLGMLAFNEYIRQTNDIEWIKKTWSQWQLHAEKLISQISEEDGLVYLSYGFIGPGAGSSAVSCVSVEALKGMSEAAEAIGEQKASKRYRKLAKELAKSINNHLWNEQKGAYSLDVSSPDSISTAGTGLCVTSGVAASAGRASEALASMKELASGPGYKDNSGSGPGDKISPFMNGFLLPAFFEGGSPETGLELIHSLWGAMSANPETASGASWEYVSVDGDPGLSWFTSLAHPWGGAATFVLTEYVAGLRRQSGVEGFGHKRWVLDPSIGVRLGLKRARAQVETPYGLLSATWKVCGERIVVKFPGKKEYKASFNL